MSVTISRHFWKGILYFINSSVPYPDVSLGKLLIQKRMIIFWNHFDNQQSLDTYSYKYIRSVVKSKSIFYKENDWSVLFLFSKDHVCSLNSKKHITHFLTLKAHPISVISVVLHYEQLYRAPSIANDGIFL